MSNKALLHSNLLTKLANAELVIVNVIEENSSPPSTYYHFSEKKERKNLKK
ncbi:MAG TPA: hypothetical protein VFV86_13310 [Nitrososphaeraceae archaeon]|nr:hypothetical protein [Nitrososphaeraceae archaeon]